MYIDARDPSISSLARYANTAAKQYLNAKLVPSHVKGQRSRLLLRATHDIQAGDEIFTAYGGTYKKGTYVQIPQRTYEPVPAHADHPSHPTSGRVRWKINADEDWSLFSSQLSDSLLPWFRKWSKWARHDARQAYASSNAHVHAGVVPAVPVRSLHASMYSEESWCCFVWWCHIPTQAQTRSLLSSLLSPYQLVCSSTW